MDLARQWLGADPGQWPGRMLADLPDATLHRLLAGGQPRHLTAGTVALRHSDRQPLGGLVLSGVLRVYLQAADGRTVTIFHAHPGSMVGILSAAVGHEAPIVIRAETDADLLELGVSHLRSVAQHDAAFAFALATELGLRLLASVDHLAEASFSAPRARLARLLLDIAQPGPAADVLIVEATQQSLAEGIGTVREVVARNLARFRAAGVVSTDRGTITILDAVALAAAAGHWSSRER